ncbi:MAG: CDP-alcohol phosphatidyltransferase family protein [Candidatus Obscuribacterales bacterium]|nr:CDP-alcohol phosphatidyltransferase family protein [Candidatus Obscuribacterales bacterium]
MNVPNCITIGRVILALATVALLWSPADNMLWTASVLTALVIWGDGLDGYFARKLKQTTTLGAVLDIAGDRVVEMMYWIVFAALNWIPVWIPLLYLVRGTFVDAIRSKATEKGLTAFGEKTMMESGLGKFLVASNFSRFTYAVTKAAAFCLIIAAQVSTMKDTVLPSVAMGCAYVAAAFCVVRGLPVFVEGRRLMADS